MSTTFKADYTGRRVEVLIREPVLCPDCHSQMAVTNDLRRVFCCGKTYNAPTRQVFLIESDKPAVKIGPFEYA